MKNFRIFTKTKNSFEGQLPDEKTLKIVRMHWLTLAREGVFMFIAFVPILVMIFTAGYSFDGELQKFLLFLSSILFLFWWYWVFYMTTMYYLNIWIITDHRLIESEQLGMFRRNYTELSLTKIQDISVNVEGFFETMLNVGMVEVQSAAAEKKFKMVSIGDPLKVKETIIGASNAYIRMHPGKVEEKFNV